MTYNANDVKRDPIGCFLHYLHNVRGYAQNTTMAYGKDLRAFGRWIAKTEPTLRWSTIGSTQLMNYQSYLHQQELANSTICRKMSAISSFYDFLILAEVGTYNPAKEQPRPKKAATLPKSISTQHIWAAMADPRTEIKTKLWIALLVETGIRLQEMLDLDTGDFNAKERSILIHGKGAKERKVYYGDMSRSYLNAVIGWRRGRLFEESQREVRRAIFMALRPYCTETQLSPHALRHTYATEMLNNGATLEVISALLGHASVTTTQIYARASEPTKRRQALEYMPTRAHI